jgi:sec-independent protein translocase protein TatA
MPTLGPTELILILAIFVLVFGASRLSEVGGALGRSVREFRSATEKDDPATSVSNAPSPPARPPHSTLPTCGRCGMVVHTAARFCGSCGAAVAAEDSGASHVPAGTSDSPSSRREPA